MQWLANVMTWLLEKLFLITHNYGLAIILIVIIVRVLMHPVSKSSQVNMMRMQRDMKRLQPKMNAIKEKFKNNREAQNKAVMELYKSEGINPAGQMLGCLPLFLQMPIWIALWTALNNSISLRFQPFFFWIKNLAGPDALMHFSAPIPIPLLSSLMGPIHELNVLPVLVMGAMLLQQMFSPQSAPTPDADPAQVKQQKIMMYLMTVFMGLIFYNAPSGLNLYILTSTAWAWWRASGSVSTWRRKKRSPRRSSGSGRIRGWNGSRDGWKSMPRIMRQAGRRARTRRGRNRSLNT